MPLAAARHLRLEHLFERALVAPERNRRRPHRRDRDRQQSGSGLLAVAVAAMGAATIALGRDEGAFEEMLEAEMARRSETQT